MPPHRVKKLGESMSDSSLIRSNRRSVIQMHLANIRNGAYKDSGIPPDVAGTSDDVFNALKLKGM